MSSCGNVAMDGEAGVKEYANVSSLQDTSQCAAVSLLDVTNISFDSFLVGTSTLIPQFIFDSIDTMQHDKRPVTSVSSTSGIIDNCLLSEVSHNPLETTRSPDEISPSKQILDLLCGIDVTENKDHPVVEPDDNRDTQFQYVTSPELSDSNNSTSDVSPSSDSPDCMNTAYYEYVDTPFNDTMIHTPLHFNNNNLDYDSEKIRSFSIHDECSVESALSMGIRDDLPKDRQETSSLTVSVQCPFDFNNIFQRETNPSSSEVTQSSNDEYSSTESVSPVNPVDEDDFSAVTSNPDTTLITKALFPISRQEQLQTSAEKSLLHHQVQPTAYQSRMNHVLKSGIDGIVSPNPHLAEPPPSLGLTEILPPRGVAASETQHIPKPDILTTSKLAQSILTGGVPTSFNFADRVSPLIGPGVFATPCYINIHPTSPQTLTIPDGPPATLMSSRITPALSPTESESSEFDFRVKGKCRTSYTTKQLRILEKCFLDNPYPTTEQIEHIANDLDLMVHKLRIWFQNKRARWRKRTKDNETSARPIYQPPLPFPISTWHQEAPLSIPSFPNQNNMPVFTGHSQRIKSFTDSAFKPNMLTSNGNHLLQGKEPSKQPPCLPVVPTAVRYNSKLLTAATLSELPSAGGRVPVYVPPLLYKAPLGMSSSETSHFHSQPNRMYPLQNIHNQMHPILHTPFHPVASKLTSMCCSDSYKNAKHSLAKNQQVMSSSVGSENCRQVPTPSPSGLFQTYSSQVTPAFPMGDGRHRVAHYYRA